MPVLRLLATLRSRWRSRRWFDPGALSGDDLGR